MTEPAKPYGPVYVAKYIEGAARYIATLSDDAVRADLIRHRKGRTISSGLLADLFAEEANRRQYRVFGFTIEEAAKITGQTVPEYRADLERRLNGR